MKSSLNTMIAICGLGLLANAQENREQDPDFAKVPEPPTADSLAARASAIAAARAKALNTTHQIAASQDYRRRDTSWAGALPSEGFTIIPLQLYAGNDYYIVLGTDSQGDQIAAAAFDPDRRLVRIAPDRGAGTVVIHLTPKKSGVHYLRLHQISAPKKPTHCWLTYIYR